MTAKKKTDNDESKLWLIIGNEELPLGIAVAKTSGGAKRIFAERTNRSRESVHVEELKFKKQFVGFTPLV
jgi:hypothetical protein